MRTKLVELIMSSGQVSGFAGSLADYLIANGVTIASESLRPKAEWISVEDRLPNESGYYLIHQKAESWFGEVIQTARWNKTAQKFCGAQAGCFMEFVTHWMPLPEPPKGD